MKNILTTYLTNTAGEDSVDHDRLPDSFDELVKPDRLERGEYNVRNASPDRELRRSIAEDGILQALIVRDDPDKERLQVTDGWQRYQAATSLGIPLLPVDIYEDTETALNDAEARSIVDDWTKFDMAQHAQFCKEQLDTDDLTQSEIIQQTTEKTKRTKPTVRRYLNALQLPEVLHPLLKNRENITPTEWMALQNIQADIKQYSGLSWQVAAKAGANIEVFDDDGKLIRVMLETLDMKASTATAFIDEFVEHPGRSIQMAKQSVLGGPSPDEKARLELPRVYIDMKPEEKTQLMNHLSSTKTSLPAVIRTQLRAMTQNLATDGAGVDNHADSASIDEFSQKN
jgi:ParB/RepB/Spo0J family partition protein